MIKFSKSDLVNENWYPGRVIIIKLLKYLPVQNS